MHRGREGVGLGGTFAGASSERARSLIMCLKYVQTKGGAIAAFLRGLFKKWQDWVLCYTNAEFHAESFFGFGPSGASKSAYIVCALRFCMFNESPPTRLSDRQFREISLPAFKCKEATCLTCKTSEPKLQILPSTSSGSK